MAPGVAEVRPALPSSSFASRPTKHWAAGSAAAPRFSQRDRESDSQYLQLTFPEQSGNLRTFPLRLPFFLSGLTVGESGRVGGVPCGGRLIQR